VGAEPVAAAEIAESSPGDWNDGVVCALNHTEFATDNKVRFEIEIGAAPTDGALYMEPGKPNCIIARHYFED
jgi:hypothetical protein